MSSSSTKTNAYFLNWTNIYNCSHCLGFSEHVAQISVAMKKHLQTIN